MKNLIRNALVALSVFVLASCGMTNDKGYKIWADNLPAGSRVDYCYYVKVTDESTTYYDAFAYLAQPSTGGFLPGYTNFKYENGSDTIVKIEKSIYKEKLQAVKDGTINGSYGKIIDKRG